MKRFLLVVSALAACVVFAESQTTSQKNAIGMEFVKIEPGTFTMGCVANDTQCNNDEKPAHTVHLTKAFEMGKYEVTQSEWKSVMGSNPSTIKVDDHPVETVSKDEAHDFLAKLNAKNDGYRYRLPTEAEWEYAARAGSTNAYGGKLDDIAWHAGNSEDETHPVGKKKPNAWGLYDMEGNVREWVEDFYSNNYYSNSPQNDPTGPAGGQQGGRGGRGGPGPGGRGGPGGPNGRGGRGGPPNGEISGPCGGPVNGPDTKIEDLRQQVDCLRQQIAFLTQQLQNGRGGGPGGPPPNGGPGNGPPGGGPPPGGQLGVMRGGAWDNLEPFLRLSARYNYYGPTLRVSDVGFRAVREKL